MIYDDFFARLVAKVETLRTGAPNQEDHVALGPMIDAAQRDHVLAILQQAPAAGARLVCDGQHQGLFVQPTVPAQVTPDNPAFREEIFGPVAVITAFDSDDDAVALANGTEYGLSMAVISSSVGRALALGERLHTGLLRINDQTVNDQVINPFGGAGISGNGSHIGGPVNWEKFTQWQWLTLKGEAPAYQL